MYRMETSYQHKIYSLDLRTGLEMGTKQNEVTDKT